MSASPGQVDPSAELAEFEGLRHVISKRLLDRFATPVNFEFFEVDCEFI
jgi:hypothetical protein